MAGQGGAIVSCCGTWLRCAATGVPLVPGWPGETEARRCRGRAGTAAGSGGRRPDAGEAGRGGSVVLPAHGPVPASDDTSVPSAGTIRPVRRSYYDPSSAPGKGVVWEWENDSGSWTPYDMDVGITIQRAYEKQHPWVDLSTIGFCYVIDFATMGQINRQTQRKRRVRRRLDMVYPLVSGALPKSQSWPASPGAAAILEPALLPPPAVSAAPAAPPLLAPRPYARGEPRSQAAPHRGPEGSAGPPTAAGETLEPSCHRAAACALRRPQGLRQRPLRPALICTQPGVGSAARGGEGGLAGPCRHAAHRRKWDGGTAVRQLGIGKEKAALWLPCGVLLFWGFAQPGRTERWVDKKGLLRFRSCPNAAAVEEIIRRSSPWEGGTATSIATHGKQREPLEHAVIPARWLRWG